MGYSEAGNLEICKKAIEAKLNWGDSASWLNYDFEKLNEQIFAETNVQLSVSTLKRIFGKTSYRSSPSLTTLNTLARFIGFSDWREFTQSYVPAASSTEHWAISDTVSGQPVIRKFCRKYLMYCIIGAIVIMGLIIGFTVQNRVYSPDYSKYAFKADKIVTEGVPNSVVFTYDATAAKPQDSVFIVQTWDITRKKLIDRNRYHHSAIYYFPGYFRAKLIVNKEIVKTHNIQIKTDNWLALAEMGEGKMPLYFKKTEVLKGDEIRIDDKLLKIYGLGLYPDAPRIRLFNQTDLGALNTDNFTFETVLKNDFSAGTAACQRVQVLIQCKDDVIIIPLVAPACVGGIALAACGAYIQSADADLSGFGADLHQWTKLRVESRNKQMKFFVNGKNAYSLKFPNNAADIVGLQYRFEGAAAVKDTWIEGAGGRHDFAIK